MSLLTRKRQVAAKVESTPGTVESLAAADAKTLFYNPRIKFDTELHDQNPERVSSDQLAKIVGKRPGTFTGEIDLRGSGTATTAPAWFTFFQAMGFTSNSLYTITIGAVTSGPFTHGETVTGGTSGATGRVVMKTANGTTTLYYVPLSGTLQDAETITGGTSGASATTGSSPSEVGLEMALDDLGNESQISIGCYEDGFRQLLAGCAGKGSFNFNTGSPVKVSMEHMGVFSAAADVPLLSSISRETTVPPAFINASFTIDDYAAKFEQLQINLENDVQPQESENATYGIDMYTVNSRVITGSINPQMALAATHDFYSKLHSGSEMEMKFDLGSVAGNHFKFYAPKVQYTNITPGDRNGRSAPDIELAFNGGINASNEAFVILAI